MHVAALDAGAGERVEFRVEADSTPVILSPMQASDFKDSIQRSPFRPFSIRLTNGAEYSFEHRDDLGATKDCHMLFHFGENQAVRIDASSIVEVVEK
jgi:hypothetical protein